MHRLLGTHRRGLGRTRVGHHGLGPGGSVPRPAPVGPGEAPNGRTVCHARHAPADWARQAPPGAGCSLRSGRVERRHAFSSPRPGGSSASAEGSGRTALRVGRPCGHELPHATTIASASDGAEGSSLRTTSVVTVSAETVRACRTSPSGTNGAARRLGETVFQRDRLRESLDTSSWPPRSSDRSGTRGTKTRHDCHAATTTQSHWMWRLARPRQGPHSSGSKRRSGQRDLQQPR